ncbi:hypothetical protein UY3_00552 [Chelonia mydas]|uniref:Uncharacterized protein n=1 Tax=Chelonia mydas TaxID=8469 RepID=M7C1V8_CHEMY|nr:hypothetical protein UY3_00552 [Chelonia mydas]
MLLDEEAVTAMPGHCLVPSERGVTQTTRTDASDRCEALMYNPHNSKFWSLLHQSDFSVVTLIYTNIN